MQKKALWTLAVIVVLASAYYLFSGNGEDEQA